ncbi:hypothetical protein M3672_07970 [Microbacterium enclense]|uniref:hypothetical protein n=1 Tax=Microbacterium enclense TaxID=993073 RepID=UPI00203ADCA6|nr:hypothetical protein [Microbacterium enclense]MCM3614376.1 hypothetical protein [Microbacterium enclense]
MSVGRPVGPGLDELHARLMVELARHPLMSRGAVVSRSDLAASLDVDAETVELLVAHAVMAGNLAAATWVLPSRGNDAALIALHAATHIPPG